MYYFMKIDDRVDSLKCVYWFYVLVIVVCMVVVIVVKVGVKVIILEDGSIVEGWIGGGCVCGVVLKVVKDVFVDG